MEAPNLAPYTLLGEAMSSIWGARRAIRSNAGVHKLGKVIQLLHAMSRRFEEVDHGEFFRLPGQFESCGRSISALQRETNRSYTQSGEPGMEDLGWCMEQALEALDSAEGELRIWWVDLMCQEPAPIVVHPVSEGTIGQSLSKIHGIGPDPDLLRVMKEYDLLYAKHGDLQVNDELLEATEPIRVDRNA